MAIMTKAAARRAAKKRADGRHAWMLGFGLIVVPFLIGAGVLLLQAAPPPLHVPDTTATAEDHTEPLPRIYLEMPEPLSVAVTPQGPRVQIVLAVALRGARAQPRPPRAMCCWPPCCARRKRWYGAGPTATRCIAIFRRGCARC